MTNRQRFLAALSNEKTDRPPVWLMRQAGRYLPEYRELKQKYDFLTLVKTPDLATQVTLQPLQRFNFDAAILFSDILVIPEAMGQPYHFRDEGGIAMDFTLDSPQKISQLSSSSIPDKLNYVSQTLKILKNTLGHNQALLGFSGSPWTLATYMVEGGSSKDFSKIKHLFYHDRPLFNQLLSKITDAVSQYLLLQINSGADAIQIFDSWASICPASDYWDASLHWIQQIIQKLPKNFPIIFFPKGMSHLTNLILQTNSSALALDWTVPLHSTKQSFPSLPLQGNLDPTILNTTPEIVASKTKEILSSMQNHPGFIFNLGHGILPSAKIDNVHSLVNTIHEFSNTP